MHNRPFAREVVSPFTPTDNSAIRALQRRFSTSRTPPWFPLRILFLKLQVAGKDELSSATVKNATTILVVRGRAAIAVLHNGIEGPLNMGEYPREMFNVFVNRCPRFYRLNQMIPSTSFRLTL